MASTDSLIDSLVEDLGPVPAQAVETRLMLGLALGGVVTAVAVLFVLGLRPDLSSALHGTTIWMKWGYTLSIGAIALVGVSRLARPERRSNRWLWTLAVPVALLAVIAVVDLRLTPVADWPALWLGHSWSACPMRVLLLSLPIFAGFLWSFRTLAPTRLRLAGAMAGLAAGGCAATLYGFACPETSALFVLTWYSLGIALAMGVGALVGPRVLRW